MSVSVLFVCLGNICRSPTAHGVFQRLVDARGLSEHIRVDSCGTGDWHIDRPADRRTVAAALERGYDLAALRARQIAPVDFEHFDYILAMDAENLHNLQRLRPTDFRGELALLLDYAEGVDAREVPDPYYGGPEGFSHVLDLVENAAEGLLRHLAVAHRLS
jgi:protein-tyrosine phosphatase